MANIKIQLDILHKALELKKDILQDIFVITEAMAKNYNSPEAIEGNEEDLMKQKQELIGRLESVDNGFLLTYDRIKVVLNGHQELYHEEIQKLQALIKEVGDMDVAIRVMEKRNEAFLLRNSQMPRKRIPGTPLPKQVAAAYNRTKHDQNNT